MAECAQADDLMPAIQRHNPDVVLVDQDLLSASDPGLLRRLLRWHPGLRVLLLLAGEPPDDYLGRAAAAGAAGFVLRQADTSLLVKALRAVASGRTWLQRELTERLVQDYARATTPTPADHQPALSRRQSQLLALLAQGLTNREIAQRLSLSEKTVKAHLTALYRKLGVSNRVGAARVALERSPGRPEAAERVT
jgi:DNA-binding NarL/FixJ family response regulator